MSAFAGVLYLDGRPVQCRLIELMIDTIPQYEPEGRGLEVRGSFGVGHLLRRITPEDDFESQPLVSRDGNFILAADVRLDNRDELAAKLEITHPETVPDSVFLLAAYQKWEEDCVDHLLGGFSFAIWDDRKQQLFCVRDHLGEYPFFYYQGAEVFAFGNAMQGLLALQEVPKDLNEAKLADFMASTLCEPESTIFSKIDPLPPGHFYLAGNNHFKRRRYWALDPDHRVRLSRDSDYVEAFTELFRKAVRCRLRTRHRIGLSLSGGLDSSAVAVMAADLLKRKDRGLTAFSCIPLPEFKVVPPKGQIYDESPYVEAVKKAAEPAIDARYVRARGLSFLTDLEEFFWLFCFPIRNPGYHPWMVSMNRQARKAKIRALLTGQRGNYFFSAGAQGYVLELATSGHWWRLWTEISAHSRRVDSSCWRLLRNKVLYPLIPLGLLRYWPWFKHGKRPPWWTLFPLNSEFARDMGPLQKRRAAGLDPYSRPRPQWREEAAQIAYASVNDLAFYENGQRLGSGLDVRDPTGDMRLVRFCLALPSEVFMRNGENRRMVRESMSGLLPEKVRTRTEFGFQGADLCLRMDPLRRDIAELLAQFRDSAQLRRYLDLPRLGRLWETWDERERSNSFATFYGEQQVLARGILMGCFLDWLDGTVRDLGKTQRTQA